MGGKSGSAGRLLAVVVLVLAGGLAVVGGYYAAGMSPDELEQLLAGANWADLFVDRPDRRNRSFRRKSDDRELLAPIRLRLGKEGVALPLGFVQGQKLDRLLKSAKLKTTEEQDFDRFPIRFRAVAADARTGERVVIAGGGLARGVRASMSVPGLFAPVERDGRLLVDGGYDAGMYSRACILSLIDYLNRMQVK